MFENVTKPITIDEDSLFEIHPPEEENGPYLLSGKFLDSKGNLSLVIDKNEWKAYDDNWDVNTVKRSISIREKLRGYSLELEFIPPSEFWVKKLNMRKGTVVIKADDTELIIKGDTGKSITVKNCFFGEGHSGVHWQSPDFHIYRSLRFCLMHDAMDSACNYIMIENNNPNAPKIPGLGVLNDQKSNMYLVQEDLKRKMTNLKSQSLFKHKD